MEVIAVPTATTAGGETAMAAATPTTALDLEVLSLAGATLATIVAEINLTVEQVIERIMVNLGNAGGHLKLVHNGNVLDERKTLSESNIAASATQTGSTANARESILIYGVHMPGPRPGRYAGGRWKSNGEGFMNVRWQLVVLEDATFAIEKCVTTNVSWVDTDVCVTGVVTPCGELLIDECFASEDIVIESATPTSVSLKAPSADFDGGCDMESFTLQWQGSVSGSMGA
mmetsp:Transcript_66169/g.158273  ORF Transcript_66169/g.158273 Transcript_66169/m.158273 type:complete len:230 (+) Transcript_66169:73-762(+)|eukprot:CAMPEP_0178421464 /NCGR_PEP_ID=MMETSP0689_2-20121128/26661_1 /TAXON_ID=160604 /ORGANISM="Amphidinium massartii, Strain CS-259" /LENGTH=229 /DNA_ID=CAMNT_0020042977 /DNA_START=45 /DNA_END=734 /DNA_ORIENTATION=+